jgi:hypothetical protein
MEFLSLAILCGVPCFQAPTREEFFRGEIRNGPRSCRIELELAQTNARVDLPSRWELGLSLEVRRDGERLVLELPELGSLSLKPAGANLVGTLRNGAHTATVALEPCARPEVQQTELRFPSGELELVATLGMPPGPGPHPALVLVPGGGDSQRTQPSTRFLAEYLPRFGYACLVYDKRGSGASGGDWRSAGIEELAQDALAAVEALHSVPEIDLRRIGFFAASQGAWVARAAIARAPGRVAFLVNHSGPAVSLLAADTFALRSGARAAGLDEAEQEEVLALWRLECEALRAGVAPDAHAPLLEALEGARLRPWFKRLPYEATSGRSWWVDWYRRVMDFDGRAQLESLRLPTLWLYGSADTQSDVVANLTALAELARDGRPWSAHLFPEGDHGILVPLFEGGGPRTMAAGYFELLFEWLACQARG